MSEKLSKQEKQVAVQAFNRAKERDFMLVCEALWTAVEAVLAQRQKEQCLHCGPTCLGGAAHNARAEDGVMYQPSQPVPQADVVERMLLAFNSLPLDRSITSHQNGLRHMAAAAQVAFDERDKQWEKAWREFAPTVSVIAGKYGPTLSADDVIYELRARLAKPQQETREQKVAILLRTMFHENPAQSYESMATEIIAALEGGSK